MVDRSKPKILSREEIEKTKKCSIIDGSAYNVMYGFGEQYVTAYALKLGASNSEIGILSSVPAFIGALFQILAAKLTDKVKDRKRIVTIFVFLQAVMLLPLFIIPFLTKSMLLLTVIFSLYLIFANMGGPAWNSWIGDVVEADDRARYFAKRNKIAIAVLLISVLTAGIILNYFSDTSIWTGFGILFCIAFLGRMTSWYFLSRQQEPGYTVKDQEEYSFKDFLKMMPNNNFGNFVMFRSLVAFAVMIASPFFAVYMLRDLNFSYIQYTSVVLAPMIIKVLTMTYWSKYSMRFGNKKIMFVSAFLIALIPFWWFLAGYFAPRTTVFYFIILAECLSGFAWAGFELTTFNYMLETSKPEKRAKSFAYFNVVFGTAVLIGGLLGSYLVQNLNDLHISSFVIPTILAVFIISTIARVVVPLLYVRKMHEVRAVKDIDERKLFFDLVVGKPLHSALSYTNYTILAAEKNINTINRQTIQTLGKITGPVKPIIDGVINLVDEGLDKAEPVRKKIEPKIIRERKKAHYEELVSQDYREYSRTHPKIIKRYKNIKKYKNKPKRQ